MSSDTAGEQTVTGSGTTETRIIFNRLHNCISVPYYMVEKLYTKTLKLAVAFIPEIMLDP